MPHKAQGGANLFYEVGDFWGLHLRREVTIQLDPSDERDAWLDRSKQVHVLARAGAASLEERKASLTGLGLLCPARVK